MKRPSKILSIILALLMITAFPSCSESKTNSDETANESVSAENPSAEESETETEASILDNLPTKNYNGYDFRVLTQYSNYAITDFDYDEINGETINDAVYNRNRKVEENLSIKINNDKGPHGDYTYAANTLTKMLAAQEDRFDIMFDELQRSVKFSQEGGMINLYDIDGVDMTNPWWEKNATKYYDIQGKLYFTHSPMHLHYYESLQTPLFNKKIAEEYRLENLYDTVMEGRWTLDKYSELANSVVTDSNGDGKMRADEDIFGASVSTNCLTYFVIGADHRFTDMGEDGKMFYNGVTEKWISITEKLQTFYGSRDNFIDSATPGVDKFAAAFEGYGYIGAFTSNRALFYGDVLGRVKNLREMDADFGILPLPKYDEEQKDYISTFYIGAAILYVPVTNLNYKNIGPILEQLGAYSYVDLIPAYYEINIKGKQVRDEESLPILEMMLENITFDLGLTFQLGAVDSEYPTIVVNNDNLNTKFKAKQKLIPKMINRIYESYEKLNVAE